VREHGCAAVEGHARAQVGAAGLARPAAPARLARVHRDPVVDPHARDLGAHLDHVARDLMSEDQGLAHREVADPALEVIVQIGAADTPRPESHPHLIRPERQGRSLLDPQLPRRVQHTHAHRPILPAFEPKD
jgi:hypothetical protein